jgi:hypothetical protein
MRALIASIALAGAALLAAPAGVAHAQDGRFVLVAGDVTVSREQATPAQAPRRPVNGDPVGSGDRIDTGADGRAQLRFSDGTVLSLQPNSQFAVDAYRFDAARQQATWSLGRGTLRMLTGAIGKRDHRDWKLITPTATIGVRGTEFVAEQTVCDPRCSPGPRPGLRVAVTEGRVVVANAAGEVEVPAGRAVQVPGPNEAPRTTAGRPAWLPLAEGASGTVADARARAQAAARSASAVAGTSVTDAGGQATSAQGAATGPVASRSAAPPRSLDTLAKPVAGAADPAAPTTAAASAGESVATTVPPGAATAATAVGSSASVQRLAAALDAASPGAPVPPGPAAGASIAPSSLDPWASSAPAEVRSPDESIAPNARRGPGGVLLAASGALLAANLAPSADGRAGEASTAGPTAATTPPAAPPPSAPPPSAPPPSAAPPATTPPDATPPPAATTPPATTSPPVATTPPATTTPAPDGQSPPVSTTPPPTAGTPPPTPPDPGAPGVPPLAAGTRPIEGLHLELRQAPVVTSATLASARAVVALDEQRRLQSVGLCPSILCLDRGSARVVDAGADAVVSWGRWIDGAARASVLGIGGQAPLDAAAGLHYLVGIPTVTMPTEGSATYSLLGGTRPTFSDGSRAPGQATAAASVWFASGRDTRVGFDGTVAFDGDARYRFVTPGGLANPGASTLRMTGSSTFRGTLDVAADQRGNALGCGTGGAGCRATVSGVFLGPQAGRMGVGYTLSGPGSSDTTVNGVTVLRRDP